MQRNLFFNCISHVLNKDWKPNSYCGANSWTFLMFKPIRNEIQKLGLGKLEKEIQNEAKNDEKWHF